MYIPAIIRTCATITKLEMRQRLHEVKRAKRNNGSRKDVL